MASSRRVSKCSAVFQTGQCHGEISVAVGVYRPLTGFKFLLADDTFNGYVRLALIEHERLRVEDPPMVAQMGVSADGRRVAPEIEPSLLHPLVIFMLIMSEDPRSDRT